MYSPPLQLQPINTAHYFVSGDVTIHEGVAIAPGVLLQADPDSHIVIGVGVCLGIGCVIHAHGGGVRVGAGAMIGAGVLIVGQVAIGDRACIGSATTIFNSTVDSGEIIPAGSLLGDHSRPPDELQVTDTQFIDRDSATSHPIPETDVATSEPTGPTRSTPPEPEPQPMAMEAPEAVEGSGVNVYGQMYVNQLLVKLFPHKQDLNNPDLNNSDLNSSDLNNLDNGSSS
jgi:carbon dioxide concentrating mechanism protein CcmN